ncbi:MAG: biliverdin-producing heme oxygenase [Bdellovibrionales bacterium]|nr:biliverdin-producing heme oxygenase [Bdellovibrionales bacterium]
MTLHELLKTHTAQVHKDLEKKLNLLSPDMTIEAYIQLLKSFYGFYSSFESHLIKSEYNHFMENRLKSKHIVEDLISLGLSEKEIGLISITPLQPHFSLEQWLGSLYVIEGSTLGAQVLTIHFTNKFNFLNLQGSKFFDGYGPKTGLYWKEFLSFLEKEWKDKSLSEDKIIASAQSTFLQIGLWLTKDFKRSDAN